MSVQISTPNQELNLQVNAKNITIIYKKYVIAELTCMTTVLKPSLTRKNYYLNSHIARKLKRDFLNCPSELPIAVLKEIQKIDLELKQVK